MSQLSFNERFQIKRATQLNEKDFSLIKENPYAHDQLMPYMIGLLLPLTSPVAAHILEKCPGLANFMIEVSMADVLCVDGESFKKVTFLLSQTEFKDRDKQKTLFRKVYLAAKAICPEEASQLRDFYSGFLK